jgi:carbon-monoxide dehydrogenase large subunit
VFVESSGVAPSRLVSALGVRTGFFESAEIRVDATGGIVAALGTHSHGQGHATTFAQVLASRLGVDPARIRIVEGDTAAVPLGTGTFGSRSLAVGGSALDRACVKIVAKGRRIAAHLLEAAEGDIAFADGIFRVTGTDRGVTFAEVARAWTTSRCHARPSASGGRCEPARMTSRSPRQLSVVRAARRRIDHGEGIGVMSVPSYFR